ncbi:MAG: hypothetical protein R2850_01565 [Bacteroidia bacterium]
MKAIEAVQPVDMFPQTTHVENIVKTEAEIIMSELNANYCGRTLPEWVHRLGHWSCFRFGFADFDEEQNKELQILIPGAGNACGSE